MGRLVSAAARAAFAVVAGLALLAALRLAPVEAASPWDVRVAPLLAWGVALAALGSFAPARRRSGPTRGLALALAGCGAALALVVLARGGGGLPAEVASPRGALGALPRGPIDLIGADLAALPPARRHLVTWRGALRVRESGRYRIWAQGRGRVRVVVDGAAVLEGEASAAGLSAVTPLGAGARGLEVTLEHAGPSPRLRLGWNPPQAPGGEPGARAEPIPARLLGPPGSGLLWRLTDLLALACAALLAALAWRRGGPARARLPAPTPVTRREVALSLAAYVALAVVMTWPLASDPAGLGVVDRPDGRLNTWILAWDVHALGSGRNPFDAPAFHPLPDSLAFSENLLLASLLAAPALLAGGPVLGYNAVWLLSLVVSGLGAELLVRRVCGDRAAAFAAGALFAFGAHRWSNTAHLHAHVTLFLPLALLALDRFAARPGVGRGLLVGLLVALQGLASVYLGAITAIGVALALAATLSPRAAPAILARLLPGALLAALLLLPVATPYFRMRAFEGVEFDLATVSLYATTPESWLASGAWPWFDATRRHLPGGRDPLFPGAVPLVAGLAGLAVAPRRYRRAFVVLALASVTLSLGPATPVYRWLHENVVLLRGIRALARFAVLPTLGLAVLAGLAVAGRRRAPLALLLLGLAEAWSAPLSLGRWEGPGPAARSLAGGRGAVVHLPLGEGDTAAMLDGVAHFRPLVNGDSGFIPRPYTRAMELLERGPDGEALRFLRAVGVTRVVSAEALPLPLLAEEGGERIHAVPPGDAAAVPQPATPRATLWSPAGVRVDLGAREVVSRVTFAVSEAPWQARPRVEASLDGRRWTALEARASLADATLALYRDPRSGRGEVRFAPVEARYLRLRALPARPGLLGAGR